MGAAFGSGGASGHGGAVGIGGNTGGSTAAFGTGGLPGTSGGPSTGGDLGQAGSPRGSGGRTGAGGGGNIGTGGSVSTGGTVTTVSGSGGCCYAIYCPSGDTMVTTCPTGASCYEYTACGCNQVLCMAGGGSGGTGGASSSGTPDGGTLDSAPHDMATDVRAAQGGDTGGTEARDAFAAEATQAIGIPIYVDPSASPSTWAQVTGAAPTVALLVANPDSGPGVSVQASYTQAITAAHAVGQIVVGYVHTSYGARNIAQVEADVDAWYSFYPMIDGIFSDETSTDDGTIALYYQPLFQYVKSKTGGQRLVVINPGTMIDESFMAVADIVVTFEDTYAHYTDGSYPVNPLWMAGYSRWRFWHLVLSATTAADMQNAISIARQRNVGYVYVTDQPPTTAYSQIVNGVYWQTEIVVTAAP